MKKKLSDFFELTRAYSLPVSFAPFLIAFFCALKVPFLDKGAIFFNGILIFIAVSLLHLTFNLFDDYIDVKNIFKKTNNLRSVNFKNSAKARLILDGTFSFEEVEIFLLIMLLISFLIGLYFLWQLGGIILFYMLITLILSVFYPISSKYCLGEITIGVIFGPLLINGVYFALTGQFDPSVFNFSISSGIMTTVLLVVHSLMDFEYDINSDKKTIPVILKNKNLTVNFISLMVVFSYFLLVCTVLKYNLDGAILLPVLLTLPVSVKLILSLYDYIEVKDVKFQPRWYFGVMENWNEIENKGLAYFMFRFYLARNLASIFNITLAIVLLIWFTPVFRRSFGTFQYIFEQFMF